MIARVRVWWLRRQVPRLKTEIRDLEWWLERESLPSTREKLQRKKQATEYRLNRASAALERSRR